jgi:hypothetical protein
MNTRLVTMLVLLLPALVLADDGPPAPQADTKPLVATRAPEPKLGADTRRQLAIDDQIMRNLALAATRETETPPRKPFGDPGILTVADSRIAANLRTSRSTTHARDGETATRCGVSECTVYDSRGRQLYSYRTARIGIDVPATLEAWQSCQSRQDDMLSTFDRQDRCNGITSRLPTPWDPTPRAWP